MPREKAEKAEKAEKIEKARGSNGSKRTKYIMYKGEKYIIHIGKRGGEYILVGVEKKKIYLTKIEESQKEQLNTKLITEDIARKIFKAKEERDLTLFYKKAEIEPEEETLEQKIQRQKKELLDNRI